MYSLTASNSTVRDQQGRYIAISSPEYQAWIAAGNTPAPFVAPQAPTPRVPCTPIYCRRVVLTQQELMTLTTLSMTNAQMAVWLFDMAAATYILPADPELQTGLDGLVALNILTPQRRTEIMAALTLGMPINWETS